MKNLLSQILVVLTGIMFLFEALNIQSYAADTTEVFDIGATDFEFYSSFTGIGKSKNGKSISSDVVLGFGLTDIFSTYLTASVESNEYFSESTDGLGFGLFLTALDTDYFDFDIYADITAIDEMIFTPGFEINIDFSKDISLAGLYFRVAESISGEEKENTPEDYEIIYATEITYGAYCTLNEKAQVLIEFDMTVDHEENKTEFGALALGFNYLITDYIELISQGSIDILGHNIPGDNTKNTFSISLGFIATMPMSGGK